MLTIVGQYLDLADKIVVKVGDSPCDNIKANRCAA